MKNTSTIYAKNAEGIYKILHIEVKEDDSLHVYFPRTEGFLVKGKQDIELNGVKSEKITFERNIDSSVFNPYFSYHPGKKVLFTSMPKMKVERKYLLLEIERVRTYRT